MLRTMKENKIKQSEERIIKHLLKKDIINKDVFTSLSSAQWKTPTELDDDKVKRGAKRWRTF